MEQLNPIYTETAECQDCYKCLRQCPVKSILVDQSSARVMKDYCITCGHCVTVCPVGAKKNRNDLVRAQKLLRENKKVYATLAPSWVSEFPNTSPQQMISALKQLGFIGVSETALGAEEVSSHLIPYMEETNQNLFISSACPSVVAMITKYYHHLSPYITPFLSPALCHAKKLKELYGDDIGIVFISPCIAKKNEADSHPELMDVSITFQDLVQWLLNEQIDLTAEANINENFVPYSAKEGKLYPIDGGMITTLQSKNLTAQVNMMTFSGIHQLQFIFKNLDPISLPKKLFLEVLACDGGCINGPRAINNINIINKKFQLQNQHTEPINFRSPSLNVSTTFPKEPLKLPEFSPTEIKSVMARIGKRTQRDELNCGGCGYDSCRDFAIAFLRGKAETSMCVSYMRKLAQNKAEALIKAMPTAVVIIDDSLSIVECNKKFVDLLDDEFKLVYDVNPRFEKVKIQKILPFANLFQSVLEFSEDIIGKDISYENKILRTSIFTIEKNRYVGAILQDVTQPSVERDQIINKAQEVILKNLTTVQKIAYLLGENAAESEVLLNSIINSFQPQSPKPMR